MKANSFCLILCLTHLCLIGFTEAVRYRLVIDASSYKSTLNIFRVEANRQNLLGKSVTKISEGCHTNVGLSQLKDPAEAGRQIVHLLEDCQQNFYDAEEKGVQLIVMGTGALRLKSQENPKFVEQIFEEINSAVYNYIHNKPAFDPRFRAHLLGISSEAIMATIHANYELGNLDLANKSPKFVGIIKLGDGSLHFNYFAKTKVLTSLKTEGNGNDKLGIMSFLDEFYGPKINGVASSLCFHPDFRGQFSFNGVSYQEKGVTPRPGFDRTIYCYQKALKQVQKSTIGKHKFNGFFKFHDGSKNCIKNGMKALKFSTSKMNPDFHELEKINKYYCNNPAKSGHDKPYCCIMSSQVRAIAVSMNLYMDNRMVEWTDKYSWPLGVALTMQV